MSIAKTEAQKARVLERGRKMQERKMALARALAHPDAGPRKLNATPARTYGNATTTGDMVPEKPTTWRAGQDDAMALHSRGIGT